jgi:hypothetical protein
MFASWKDELKAQGFEPASGTKGRTVLVRPRGPREQTILLSRPRSEEGTLVQLGIGMQDPYSGASETPLILNGRLDRAQGVATETLEGGTWWKPGEEQEAWRLLLDQGFPWLERHGEPRGLIDFYERALREGVPERAAARGGLLKRLFQGDGELPDRGPRRPPIYHLWLSLLYEELGDRPQACEHCLSYYRVVQGRAPGLSEEPGRTVRQLAALGCAAPG